MNYRNELNRQNRTPRPQALRPLPNLLLRSLMTLCALYALLTLVLITAVEFGYLKDSLALILGIGIALFQFVFGPFLMDLSLRLMYKARWQTAEQLPEHLRVFIQRVCDAEKMRFPSVALIDDGAPQAFTYGHTPNNARIVISRGILELLEPEEAEAVVAHEIGHAVHWDMLVMTMANLVPLIAYFVFRMLRTRDEKDVKAAVAWGAYAVYLISQYVVLWLSRAREYYADRFAGEVTKNPALLAAALVKIGYGLAAQKREEQTDESKKKKTRERTSLQSVGALGIFDARASKSLVVGSQAPSTATEQKPEIDTQRLKRSMRWDLWNPWAVWYELNSTHPLIAHRLQHLGEQALASGQTPYVIFDEQKRESFAPRFMFELFVAAFPTVMFALAIGAFMVFDVTPKFGAVLLLWGVSLGISYVVRYPRQPFPEREIGSLLEETAVSGVRPIPCTLTGIVIGRGVPGCIVSEDFVMRDKSGILFLDYRQPLALWELLFGLLKAGKYNGQTVTVEGWYRRAPVPFLQIKKIACGDTVRRSWSPALHALSAFVIMLLGLAVMFGG